ncbi:MAG TPA: DUF3795 domain-containing protein [Anaerolineae bacterium]|nr:DUF3795 domain-containing protein [Anaerolineae bacterium]
MVTLEMMAACGLDCGVCEIRLAPHDPQAARVVVDWFRSQGWLKPEEGMEQALERTMYCCGCLGDRSAHWSADCWILACCVGAHGLTDCSQCPEFACERLESWATQNSGYGAALRRLMLLRQRSCGPAS